MHRVLIPPYPRPSHHKQSSYVSLSMEDDPFEGKGPLNRYVLRIFCSISVSFFPPPLCSSLRYSNSTMTEGKEFSPSIKASFPLWGVGFFFIILRLCAELSHPSLWVSLREADSLIQSQTPHACSPREHWGPRACLSAQSR